MALKKLPPHTKSASSRLAAPVYQLKVTLLGCSPAIWRRLLVPGNADLGWLHNVLQVAMGWTNSHLHHFIAGGKCYSDAGLHEDMIGEENSDLDESKASLESVVPQKGAKFIYEYDFGDSWEHQVKVEKILPTDTPMTAAAVCLSGARACPPEDCGGVWGYDNLLRVLKNPRHPEFLDMIEWAGGPIDAEAFDVGATNTWLQQLKGPRISEARLRKVLMKRDGYAE